MIEELERMRALSQRERALLAEALFSLTLARAAVALLPFRMIGRFAAKPSSAKPPFEQLPGIPRVQWAVRACAHRVPFRAMCFEQGLAAWWMLRRRRVNATLHYGAARENEKLVAHVWVTACDHDVIGCEIKNRFTELIRIPDCQN